MKDLDFRSRFWASPLKEERDGVLNNNRGLFSFDINSVSCLVRKEEAGDSNVAVATASLDSEEDSFDHSVSYIADFGHFATVPSIQFECDLECICVFVPGIQLFSFHGAVPQ